MMEYNVTIGIEIHCQLKTDTKMFSGAPTSFGRKANTCVNEIDLGMPGTLPEVNKEAVKKAIMACTVESGFDNFSYFIRLFKKQYHTSPGRYRRSIFR
jgi:Asp-tRNA(Asn)/Glu-tRNA(Gln) amidotransferase B subunit